MQTPKDTEPSVRLKRYPYYSDRNGMKFGTNGFKCTVDETGVPNMEASVGMSSKPS